VTTASFRVCASAVERGPRASDQLRCRHFCTLVGIVIAYHGRQLQYSGGLAGNEPCDLDNAPVWEFKRVVMRMRIGHIYLTKPRNFVM